MGKTTQYYTRDELKRIFKIESDDTIVNNFGEHLIVNEQQEVLPRKYLVDLLGFAPTEPFMTRGEVAIELGISYDQLHTLIVRKYLPVFKINNERGSSRFFLKRDVLSLKKTIAEYYNSVMLLDDHNHKLRDFVCRVIDFDYSGRKLVCRNNEDYQIFKKYIIGNERKVAIADAFDLTTERIRQIIAEANKRLDKFLSSIDDAMERDKNLVLENELLRTKVEQYEKFINGKYAAGEIAENEIIKEGAMVVFHRLSTMQLDELGFSVRLIGGLRRALVYHNGLDLLANSNVLNMIYVLSVPADSFYKIPNFGVATMNELRDFVSSYGLRLNNSRKKINITAENVLSCVEDLTKFTLKTRK